MSDALTLFLVEDEEGSAYLMRRILERAGYQVTVCRTGADAQIVLSQSQFSLVLLDQELPDMKGLDLLANLNREGNTTPVILVTALGNEHLAAQALRAGALDYIVKDNSLTFLTDLPKRVQESATRARLQQTNRLLVEAIESAGDGFMITDLEGIMEHVNGALEKMFGYARDELLGKSPALFRSNQHSLEFYENMWRTLLACGSWQGELINRRKDGSHVDISLTMAPILNSHSQATHFVGIYRDISERKAMERQLAQAQKMQSVGTLAAGVAHEFNNLLAGIQGYATLGLRDPGLPLSVKEFLNFIIDLSERAANLTRRLLAFARKPALSRQPTDMKRLLQSTAELVKSSLKIDVAVTNEETDEEAIPLAALADANQLQQVLVNLTLNARDAMPQSPPSPVEFRLTRKVLANEQSAFPDKVPPGDYVVLEVKDHGSGMSSEVFTQSLDPFFTTKEVGQGTGLGLPVALGIIHGHQGHLTIDTAVNEGTCVRLYLPRLSEAPMGSSKSRGTPQAPQNENQPGRNILVIDDEPAVLDVVRRFLEIPGHHVLTATSGAAGQEILDKGTPVDLVILDLMIPRENGAANFQRLRRRQPNLPVLLCTGLVQADQATQLLQEGAADLLRKPFRMDVLWKAVNKALR